MAYDTEYLEQIKKIFVNNGEYNFKDENATQKFVKKVLWKAEEEYRREGYHHKYEDLKEFLYTHHVDSIAYWTYKDKFTN